MIPGAEVSVGSFRCTVISCKDITREAYSFSGSFYATGFRLFLVAVKFVVYD